MISYFTLCVHLMSRAYCQEFFLRIPSEKQSSCLNEEDAIEDSACPYALLPDLTELQAGDGSRGGGGAEGWWEQLVPHVPALEGSRL